MSSNFMIPEMQLHCSISIYSTNILSLIFMPAYWVVQASAITRQAKGMIIKWKHNWIRKKPMQSSSFLAPEEFIWLWMKKKKENKVSHICIFSLFLIWIHSRKILVSFTTHGSPRFNILLWFILSLKIWQHFSGYTQLHQLVPLCSFSHI